MIKTALIGWMRYLPFGHESLPEWGLLLVIAGAAGALLAVPLGLPQQNPKVVLAYSSIGKMGTLVCALGLALIEPRAAPAILAAVTLFAAHHGLSKGALFLGVGAMKASPTRLTFVLLALPALALAGLPFTSGAFAKELLSTSVLEVASPWSAIFFWLLPVAAVGTALLLARFLYLMHDQATDQQPFSIRPVFPWLGLLAMVLLTPLAFEGTTALIKNAWPIALAAIISIAVIRVRTSALASLVGRVPPGDAIEPLSRLSVHLKTMYGSARKRGFDITAKGPTARLASLLGLMSDITRTAEQALLRPTAMGPLWFAVAIALLFLMAPWQ